ncbi:glycosyltransferase family 39 protein [Thermopolyspora sp. NPDC052614]|uniref:glycosyltransferase family 39 protein n=1 Tax=Thermopolyspora sp. NPDC052614 TaxID=3155682 RepID=UPI00341FF9B1
MNSRDSYAGCGPIPVVAVAPVGAGGSDRRGGHRDQDEAAGGGRSPFRDTGPETAAVEARAGRHAARRRGPGRLLFGPPEDPRWARPALWAVLAVAAVLYTWALGGNGYANQYYAAAILSGTESWKAFFFGAIDSGSFITVDKPPFALWVMGLSARIFGFGAWSMLLPQAVAGVAAVGLVYSAVRRALTGGVAGPAGAEPGAWRGGPVLDRAGACAAALVAAVVMTLTPITVAINRDNNPDTVLVLLLVAAAWCCGEAVRTGRVRTLVASAVLVGFAFNTKMLQAYLVVPALASVYLYAAPGGVARRLGRLLVAGVALVVSSGWWMVVVDLWPASGRPYVGGSEDNTVWDLVIGYNGLGRVFGQGGPGGGGAGFGGEAGAGRLFNDIMAGQISWLLPFAAVALVAGSVLIGRRPRTDLTRAALLLWGGWLGVHFAIFSFSSGTFHPYYSTAMAPAVGAVTGIGGLLAWRASRRSRAWTWVLATGVVITGAWAFTVLRRTPDWVPWLPWAVAGATVVAVIGLILVRPRDRLATGLTAVTLVAVVFAGLAGPAAYAMTPLSGGVNGTNPTAGPAGGGGLGRMGFPGDPAAGGDRMGGSPRRLPSGGDAAPGQGVGDAVGRTPGGPGGSGFGGGPNGGVSDELIAYLRANRGDARWLVAVGSAQSASSIILATGGEPVIAMGGFTGGDPAMTVEKLKGYAASGELRYVLVGGGRGGPDRGGDEVTEWIEANGTRVDAADYGGTDDTGQTLYRLAGSSE